MKETDAPYRIGDDTKYREDHCCIKQLKLHMKEHGIYQTTIDETEHKTKETAIEQFMQIRKTFEVRQ